MNSELSSYFRKYLPTDNSSTCLVLNEGAGKIVARIIDDLGIPPEEPQIIMINPEASSREHVLNLGG
ncbi:MAG: hypothetical protein WCJ75_05345 [Desulfomonile sp.]